jgi:hypothetical protein
MTINRADATTPLRASQRRLSAKEVATLIKTAQTICFQAMPNAFQKPAKQKLILFSVRPERIELCCDAMAKANSWKKSRLKCRREV